MRILIISTLFFLPQIGQCLCVNASQANLRAKPKASSKLLWTVGRYMPLLEVDYQNGW